MWMLVPFKNIGAINDWRIETIKPAIPPANPAVSKFFAKNPIITPAIAIAIIELYATIFDAKNTASMIDAISVAIIV